jgi:hypothetical protein
MIASPMHSSSAVKISSSDIFSSKAIVTRGLYRYILFSLTTIILGIQTFAKLYIQLTAYVIDVSN